MPVIFRFYIKHCVIGFALSAIFIAGLLWLNIANLWHLISTSDIGLMALVVFWVLNGIVFAGVQTGVAVMLMSEENREDKGPKGGTPAGLTPLRVRAGEPRN
ncbi:hypothetical protein [Sulfitobacter pacificus]|uniref:Uncharacterized protein n=1 Tax=Sulfitobacter pacificus TaxID=1499314 RepID=A0ABQ5VFZ5_9RHOB|nr:hypothetical protein [Sulfitobacter pacificus]GLQ26002.1 hypothetical protein GCM10007927_08050 [Sulfitobacter pacificus]